MENDQILKIFFVGCFIFIAIVVVYQLIQNCFIARRNKKTKLNLDKK